MNAINRSKILTGALVFLLAGGLSGCYGVYHEGPPVYRSAYYYHPYHYYYYPSVGVYFHISSGDYFYIQDHHWVRVRTLPSQIYLHRHDRVGLWIDVDRPYLKRDEHARKYRPNPRYKPYRDEDRRERSHNRERHEAYDRKSKRAP